MSVAVCCSLCVVRCLSFAVCRSLLGVAVCCLLLVVCVFFVVGRCSLFDVA